MNCLNCGAGLISGASFCGACGARVDAATVQPTNSVSQLMNAAAAPSGHGIQIDPDARGQGRGYSYEVLH
ncbi:MAG: hypothetical protein M3R15_21460, partial [Acidobacteriota bacterium]|nr:hypothetical protein [Acidobacteriota bacterium]